MHGLDREEWAHTMERNGVGRDREEWAHAMERNGVSSRWRGGKSARRKKNASFIILDGP